MVNLFTKNKKGFTLLELLVVIAVLGLMASIILVSLSSSRKRSRDAKRVSDLKELQKALELYFNSHNEYPMNLGQLIIDGYIQVEPVDPTNNDIYKYRYCVNSTVSKYHLGAVLETGDYPALQADSDLREGEDGCLQSFDGDDSGKIKMYDLAP